MKMPETIFKYQEEKGLAQPHKEKLNECIPSRRLGTTKVKVFRTCVYTVAIYWGGNRNLVPSRHFLQARKPVERSGLPL